MIAAVTVYCCGVRAEEFNYGSNEDLLYEISFSTIDVDNAQDWDFPNGSGSFNVSNGYLETKNHGWIATTLNIENAVGKEVDLANKKTSVYFSARLGLLVSTGNKLGFLLNSSNDSASYPYMGAYIADKDLDPIQDGLGYGSTYYSVAPTGVLNMTANRMDFDDFRLVYTDNLDGTMTLELDRDAGQDGTWTNLATTLLEGTGDFDSGWRTADRFGNRLADEFKIVFRTVDTAIESMGVTQSEIQDLYDYGQDRPCFQHKFDGNSNGGFDFDYMSLAHHYQINTDSTTGINYLDRLYDGWNGMAVDMLPTGIITSGNEFKFLLNDNHKISVYFTLKFAGTGTGNKVGVLLKSANSDAVAQYMGAYVANDGTGQAHMGIMTTHMGGLQNSDSAYSTTLNPGNFVNYRLDFIPNSDETISISLKTTNDPNQYESWSTINTVTVPTIADSGTNSFLDQQAFGSDEVEKVIVMFRSAADGLSKIAVTGCFNCATPPVGDSNGDCTVNLFDFSVLSESWLDCGFEPAYLCE
jgi:hypothetical protein